MERRNFIRLAGSAAAAGLFTREIPPLAGIRGSSDLSYLKITDIKFTTIKLKYPRLVGKNSQLDVHGRGPESGIHILYTDHGATGWGLNRGSQKMLAENFELIRGKNYQIF